MKITGNKETEKKLQCFVFFKLCLGNHIVWYYEWKLKLTTKVYPTLEIVNYQTIKLLQILTQTKPVMTSASQNISVTSGTDFNGSPSLLHIIHWQAYVQIQFYGTIIIIIIINQCTELLQSHSVHFLFEPFWTWYTYNK